MENKIEQIYFTEENLNRLQKLYWELSVADDRIAGGNITIVSVYEVLNTLASNSIGARRVYHENILEKQGRISKWKMTPSAQEQRERLEVKIEFLDLAEGYAVYKEQINTLNAVELGLLAERERISNTGLTKKQNLKRIDKALAKIDEEKEKMATE